MWAVSRAFSGVSLLMWTSVRKISSGVCDNVDGDAASPSSIVVGWMSGLSILVKLLGLFAVVSSVFES